MNAIEIKTRYEQHEEQLETLENKIATLQSMVAEQEKKLAEHEEAWVAIHGCSCGLLGLGEVCDHTNTKDIEREKQYHRTCDILKDISDSHYKQLGGGIPWKVNKLDYDFERCAYEPLRWFGLNQEELVEAVEKEAGRDITLMDDDDLILTCKVLYFG